MALRAVLLCQRRTVGTRVTHPTSSRRHASTNFVPRSDPANISTTTKGLKVVSQSIPSALTAVSLTVNAGSANETPANNGVANLLAQANVKGAQSKLNGAGIIQADTNRENTVYTVSVLPDQINRAVEILGSIAEGTTFNNEELESVRAVIAAERLYHFNTVDQEVMTDFLYSSAYQGTPFEKTPKGELKVVKKLTTADIVNFKNANYVSNNFIISGAGKIDHAKFESLAESAFSKVTEGGTSRNAGSSARINFTGSQMSIRDDTTRTAQVLIGYETANASSRDVLPLRLVQQLVGDWNINSPSGIYSSHRLAEEFSSARISQKFNSFTKFYKNTGLFGVYATCCDEDKLDDVVYYLFNEFQKLGTYHTPEDLTRAKNMLKAKVLASSESTADYSKNLGKQIDYFSRHVSLAETFYRIDNITSNDVKEVIDTYFYDADPVVIAHGPLEEMPEYGTIRAWTYWNRW